MKRLYSYYGDDFTGSTDVMEALASHGIETVMFTRMPTPTEFAPFANLMAVGLAGTSRSQSPQWMDEHLPGIFAWMKSLDARFCHYKVCSTFDSSPVIGSIGRATEIGKNIFAQAIIPLIVGAPQLKRYTYAGNLFAAYQGETYRIDRHPVMAVHPVTPMLEANMRIHLAGQTNMPVHLANHALPETGLALIDVHDAITQIEAGRRLLKLPTAAAPFVVGSSGVAYAVMKALQGADELPAQPHFAPVEKLKQIIVVSGSVSPTTERQIKHALAHGFDAVEVEAQALANPDARIEIANAATAALKSVANGRSPLVYSAMGPASDSGRALSSLPHARDHIGKNLGMVLKSVLEQSRLKRFIIAGGDTSSHALGQLDIYALTMRHPLPATPGSPLCLAVSGHATLNGLELALKGGQVGRDSYFADLRDGHVI
jgi:3-oxoisoapionate kinase